MDRITAANTAPTDRLLTFIVPIRNMAGKLYWLSELIESPSHHVIIVEDGSTDDTLIQLRQMISANTSDANLISGNFGGPGQARNAGMALCTSAYLAFFDSDDENFGGKRMEAMMKIAETTGTQIVGGGFEVREVHNNQIFRHFAPDRLLDALESNPGIWRFLFCRDFIVENSLRFSEGKMGEDLLFLLDCHLAGGTYSAFNESVYRYRVGELTQATNSPQARSDLLLLLVELERRFDEAGRQADKRLIALLWLRTLISSLKNLDFSGKNKAIQHLFVTAIGHLGLTFTSLGQLPRYLRKRVSLIDRALRIEGSSNGEV